MLMSMTGFGKASAEVQGKKVTIEIKSLNSKQLDLSVRIPSVFRRQEIELRNFVAHELERGKIDLMVTIENVGGNMASARVNEGVISAYRDEIRRISASIDIPEPADWWSILMRMPDVLIAEASDDLSPELQKTLMDTLAAAITDLKGHRRAEGARLEDFFARRIEAISALLAEIEPFEAERVPHIRARIEEALAKISTPDYDRGRLEQEMIFYIEKLDVNEEKQRLRQHLRYFIETLNAPCGQGKKLGFISQEMGREINTLGSKSNDAEMQAIVVKMKDLLEQIKEQVLNVL